MNKRVYIAGPMTGLPDSNYPAFHDAEVRLTRLGFDVENPARHFGGDQTRPYSQYMRLAVRGVSRSDVIYLMDGWDKSPGASFEYEVARRCGLFPMFSQDLDAAEREL